MTEDMSVLSQFLVQSLFVFKLFVVMASERLDNNAIIIIKLAVEVVK